MAASSSPELAAFLATPLVSLARSRADVVEFASTTPLPDAFSTLVEANISAAPVKDADGAYIGFLDVRDLTSFLVAFGEHISEGEYVVADVCAGGAGSVMANVTTAYLARRNPFVALDAAATIGDAVAAVTSRKVKRVAIVADGTATHIVSLTDLVRWFSSSLDLLPALAAAPVSEVFPNAPMFVVPASATVIEALTIMDTKQVTGLPIVDERGAIVTNVSGKDVRKLIRNPSYAKLHGEVFALVAAQRAESAVDIKAPAISVRPDVAVAKVVGKLAATKVHRIFVVNDARIPVGVVSQSVLIAKIASACGIVDASA